MDPLNESKPAPTDDGKRVEIPNDSQGLRQAVITLIKEREKLLFQRWMFLILGFGLGFAMNYWLIHP